jgi:hypothetical protein
MRFGILLFIAMFMAIRPASAAADDFILLIILAETGAIHVIRNDVVNCSPEKAQKAEKTRVSWPMESTYGDFNREGDIIAARCFPGRLKNCVRAKVRERIPADKRQLAELAAACSRGGG